MFHHNKTDDISGAGNTPGATGTHHSHNMGAVDNHTYGGPTDNSNVGVYPNGVDANGVSHTAGHQREGRDTFTSGRDFTGKDQHTSHTGRDAALGAGAGLAGAEGVHHHQGGNHHNATGAAAGGLAGAELGHHHNKEANAAYPNDHGHHHNSDPLRNDIGPGPHHTALADVPVGATHGHGGAPATDPSPATASNAATAGHGVGTGGHSADLKAAKKEEKMGKIELKVGKVLHSTSLQAKGEAKMEHAASLTAQHSELSEAERLEAEARLRRERAEGHGQAAMAHGQGGHVPGTTGAGLTQPGVAGPGGPVGLDGGFGGGMKTTRM